MGRAGQRGWAAAAHTMLWLATSSVSAMCLSPASRIRVCTSGGEGVCSGPAGKATLETLQVLSPATGPAVVGCSCLARCDRGVVVQSAPDAVDEQVNGPAACAAMLRGLGHAVDERLAVACQHAMDGDELAEAGREPDALEAYRRATSLAISLGIGLRSRNVRFPVIRVQAKASTLPIGAPAGFSGAASKPNAVAASANVTREQVVWLASTLTRRSRVQSRLARQGQKFAARRALEDSHYAVQLVESVGGASARAVPPSRGDADLRESEAATDAWEALAEAFEGCRDIEGAIFAYERLLQMEPPSSAGLAAATSAKRQLQEVVLLSHRRGLEASRTVSRSITSQALSDVESLRKVVEKDLSVLEESFSADRLAADRRLSSLRPTALEQKVLESSFASRALADLRVLRKIALSDINRLQLTLVRGDPLLTFLNEAYERALGRVAPPGVGEPLAEDSEAVLWLREQFESGALPPDPQLMRALLKQAKSDPELVARLVAEAKDAMGRDVYTRAADGAGTRASPARPATPVASAIPD